MRTSEILWHLDRLGYVWRWLDGNLLSVTCVTHRGVVSVMTGTPRQVRWWLIDTRQVEVPNQEDGVPAEHHMEVKL